jgi:hypothetical protein
MVMINKGEMEQKKVTVDEKKDMRIEHKKEQSE